MYVIDFTTVDWSNVEATRHNGETGTAMYKTLLLDGLRIRLVIYSANYRADHWCSMGHIVHCLEGEMKSELMDGRVYELKAGMTYVVSDQLSSHRSYSRDGVKLLIIDGAFLQLRNRTHTTS